MSNERAALPELTPHRGVDRRTDHRFRSMAKAICRWRPVGECDVVLADLSAGGARLIVRMREEPPPLAGIVLHGRSGAVVELGAREVYARRENGFWLMGCAFDRKLTVAELQDLLPENTARGDSR
jgi:hypothetical protein